MKKVYLVYTTDGENDWVLDIYTSQKEALKYVKYWNNKTEYPIMFWITERILIEESFFNKED